MIDVPSYVAVDESSGQPDFDLLTFTRHKFCVSIGPDLSTSSKIPMEISFEEVMVQAADFGYNIPLQPRK